MTQPQTAQVVEIAQLRQRLLDAETELLHTRIELMTTKGTLEETSSLAGLRAARIHELITSLATAEAHLSGVSFGDAETPADDAYEA